MEGIPNNSLAFSIHVDNISSTTFDFTFMSSPAIINNQRIEVVDSLLLWLVIHSSCNAYQVHHRLLICVIKNLVTLSHPSRHNINHNSQIMSINYLVVIDNQLKDVDGFPLPATPPLSSHWSSSP